MPYTALQNLRIVMVETSHPGNIGSAARAMKTMGIKDLRLVTPRKPYSQETWALASGANDIVEQAKIVPTLPDALTDCQIVIGASARSERTLQWPQMDARECGEFIAERLTTQPIALVFGRERTGLTNEELDHCNTLVHIPMAFDFLSLNIAMAIQVLAYECATAVRLSSPTPSLGVIDADEALAPSQAMESFYTHLEQSMIETRFLDPENPRLLMRRMRRLFGRAEVTVSELNILRGMLAAFAGRKFQARD